jgi:hypothetical protein
MVIGELPFLPYGNYAYPIPQCEDFEHDEKAAVDLALVGLRLDLFREKFELEVFIVFAL